jgi:hypothetical protein
MVQVLVQGEFHQEWPMVKMNTRELPEVKVMVGAQPLLLEMKKVLGKVRNLKKPL